MDVNEKMVEAHKKRVRYGYLMALFCAVFWGIWYVPGTFIWNFDPVIYFQGVVDGLSNAQVDLLGGGYAPSTTAFLVAAVMITALNAAFVIFSYFIWNLCLGRKKFSEMKRSVLELRACTKYYFFGAICGGPIAILGSFIAMGYIGGFFAAVAALAYPVIGTLLSRVWLGQKISHRAILGIIIILIGSFTAFGVVMYHELQGAGNMIGIVGGLMALCGWGVEGAIAAKGIDVSEPDIAITMRFGMENLIWWIIALPIVTIFYPQVWSYIWMMLTDPVILVTLVMVGLTFGFCYVAWYKAFPLIGVGKGQGVGSLYGICSLIFLVLFIGVSSTFGSDDHVYMISLVIGAILCTVGTLVMFTEKADDASLRETGEENS
ncbi:MAG: EamA family transporter [Methanomassiliicoccaceae archaeon]|nr:EamA family transporter [Methanomassiliicoccaceae archaeon]